MTANKVTTQEAVVKQKRAAFRAWYRRRWIWLAASLLALAIAVLAVNLSTATPVLSEAPETAKILQAQESMGNFGILIPAYLPKGFDRAEVEVRVDQSGPAGEPAADLVYRAKGNAALFVRQWVPVNPELETLSGSRIIQTKWGKSWLLTQTTNLICVWVDVGPLRVSMSTHDLNLISREQLVLAAETLGLASASQVFSFVSELPRIKDIEPPPPFEVKMNAQGVQELNLTITPGGYSPIRFAVQKGIPVKINFRALGEVGCGSASLFPLEDGKEAELSISRNKLVDTLEFTPQKAGEFGFRCSSNHYRGIMTVRESAAP